MLPLTENRELQNVTTILDNFRQTKTKQWDNKECVYSRSEQFPYVPAHVLSIHVIRQVTSLCWHSTMALSKSVRLNQARSGTSDKSVHPYTVAQYHMTSNSSIKHNIRYTFVMSARVGKCMFCRIYTPSWTFLKNIK